MSGNDHVDLSWYTWPVVGQHGGGMSVGFGVTAQLYVEDCIGAEVDDITGSSGSSISAHLGRVYIVGRAQILDYASFDDATLSEIFQ
jgi:hypothetical protein